MAVANRFLSSTSSIVKTQTASLHVVPPARNDQILIEVFHVENEIYPSYSMTIDLAVGTVHWSTTYYLANVTLHKAGSTPVVTKQLFGGIKKEFSNTGRGNFRSELNLLLCGDPGTSKSQVVQYVFNLVPHSQYTSGKGMNE